VKKVAIKIEQQIVQVAVKGEKNSAITVEGDAAPPVGGEESSRYIYQSPMDRPRGLKGTTYKIKPPHLDDALYVVINDHVVNGELRPFEIFVMSKNMASFQWISILTRLMSALMRQPHTEFPMFLIQEMLSTFDPNGGYYAKVGKRSRMMPSVVAEIGHVLREHCDHLGLVKRGEVRDENASDEEESPSVTSKTTKAHVGKLCGECGEMEVFTIDGCETCRACGDSKCM
jgi:hypothetical protein